MERWFGDLGLPALELGGYSSQTYVDDVAWQVRQDGRKSVLLCGGDHDPSGEDIERDFVARTDGFDEVRRVALTWDQVVEHNLPPQVGKSTDSRAAEFERRHGQLVQVEIDALPPAVLRGLFQEALDDYWDESIYREVVEQEEGERSRLRALEV